MLRRNHAAWIGLALGLAAVVSYVVLVVPIVSVRLPWLRDSAALNLAVLTLGLAVSALAVWRAVGRRPTHRGRRLAPLLAGLNLVVAAAFTWMLFDMTANLPDPARGLAVGRPAPRLTLVDQGGQPLTLAPAPGRNLLLVFYRGFW
jgi:hypothetical protein